MPPVSLAVLCIFMVTQQLAHPHLADSTSPLTLGVRPHQVLTTHSSVCSFYCAVQMYPSTILQSRSDLLLIISSCILFSLTGESPIPPPSTVSSSPLSTSAVAPPPQPKPDSTSQQDRKVPQPIGTERLARIRQTGSVNPPLLTTSYTASVGQGGIWSFGVGSASGKSKSCIGTKCRKVKNITMWNLVSA